MFECKIVGNADFAAGNLNTFITNHMEEEIEIRHFRTLIIIFFILEIIIILGLSLRIYCDSYFQIMASDTVI